LTAKESLQGMSNGKFRFAGDGVDEKRAGVGFKYEEDAVVRSIRVV